MSDIFNFTPPNPIYKPVIDNAVPPVKKPLPVSSPGGYHDLKTLKEALKLVKNNASAVFDFCSKELSKFSIKVDSTNDALVEAHDLVYPADTTPGYITFDEYKYLMTATDSNAIQYLKKYYEKEMRGPTGTVCLDCLNLCRAIHLEVERITNFIDKYIGDLDETAEFRTVELFQDWTETALSNLQRLKAAVETPITKGIPRTELARLTPELSTQYQAIFQAKLNTLNKLISDFMEMFEKTWNGPADNFYDTYLGPGLLFQVKVGKYVTDPNNMDAQRYPTLIHEAQGAMMGLSMDFNTALTDQLKRNEIFSQYIEGVLNNYYQRDYYKFCIKQLGQKGKLPLNNFVDSSSIDQADPVVNAPDPLTTPTSNLTSSTGLRASHNDLVDRERADAHPQYLLRDGGIISGHIRAVDGAKIDGVDLNLHRHTGIDGTPKIHGADIEFNTITDEAVDPNSTTPRPTGLKVTKIDDSLATRVVVEVTFQVPSTTGIVNYEFEVVKVSGGTGGSL